MGLQLLDALDPEIAHWDIVFKGGGEAPRQESASGPSKMGGGREGGGLAGSGDPPPMACSR